MDEAPRNIRRQVVPRWRQLHRTRPDELKSTAKADERWQQQLKALSDQEVAKAAATWRVNPTLGNASEFAAAVLMTEHEQQAVGAARQILAVNSTAMDAAKRLARRVLKGRDFAGLEIDPAALSPEDRRVTIYGQLARLKRQLVTYPRNALLHVEAARLYSSIGQNTQAEGAIERAVKLAPENRFVLRSASRFFVHDSNPERAHDLLRRKDPTQHDPWLLSAELALSSVAGRTSKLISNARNLLNLDHLTPIQLSELAAALGTIELMHGAHKRAKKLMRQSLIDPTDNSIAQARWAAQQVGSDFNTRYLLVQGTFEARAEEAYFRGADPQEIVRQCQYWWEDEPFSVRPALLGSYMAATRLYDYELALSFLNAALSANPGSISLINNKVVALAKNGKLQDARRELARIKEKRADFNPVIRATEGLVNFREGNLVAGREYYEQAIRRATELNNTAVEIRARAHLLEEEFAVGNFDFSEAIAELRANFRKTQNKPLITLWEEIERHLRATVQNAGVQCPSLEEQELASPSEESGGNFLALPSTNIQVRE